LLDKAHQAELAARQRKDAATEAKRKETLKAEKAEVQEEKDIAKEQKAEAEKVRGRQEEALKVEISSHESRAKAKQTRLDRLVEKRDKATLTHDTDVATLEKMKPEDKRRGKLESDIAAYKGRQDEIDRLQAEVEEHEKQAESLRQQYIGSLRGESAQTPPSAGPQATQAPPPGAAPAGGEQPAGQPEPQPAEQATRQDTGLEMTVLEEIEAMPAEAKRWGPVMEKYHDRLSVQELARLVAKFKEWGIPR